MREAEGLFLAEGVRVVEELVAAGLSLRLALASPALEAGERGRALLGALEARAPVRRVEDRVLESLAGTESPQGVLVVAEIPHRELDEIRVEGDATVLVLDAVQDPGNFGTLVRTAAAFGVEMVAALPGTVDPWNPKAVRAAAGASFRTPIVQTIAPALVDWLRRHGFTIYGAEAGGIDVGGIRVPNRCALVVGNEGAGLGPAMREAADALIAVPVAEHVESLNVGVAAGVLLYLLTRID